MRLRHGFEMSTKRSVGVGVGVVVRAVAISLLHLGTKAFHTRSVALLYSRRFRPLWQRLHHGGSEYRIALWLNLARVQQHGDD